MANPWDEDEIVVAAPAAQQQSMAGGNPWDADPIVDEYQGGDGPGLNIDIVGGIPESLVNAGRGAVQKEVIGNPTDSMSGLDRFRAGVGKSLVDTYEGGKQFFLDSQPSAVTALAGAALGGLRGENVVQSGINSLVDVANDRRDLQAEAANRRQTDSALLDTGAGMSGNVLGTLAQILGPGVLARGTAAAPALLPTTVRGNALQGAFIGATQPATSDADRGLNALAGGAFGGAGAAGIKGGGALLNTGRNVLARTGLTATDRQAANVLAREATNPNQLVIQQSAVPGVERTLGEASNDSGLMALENVMRAKDRGAFEPIDLRNNAARVSQLQRIAGSDSDMAAAEAARESVVDTRLRQALGEGDNFESTAAAAQQAQRQAAQAAADRAIAENQRLASLGMSGRVPVPDVPAASDTVSDGLKNLRGMVGQMQQETAARPSVQAAINDVGRALKGADESVGSLYQVRQYIGDLLQGKAGADKSYARAASRELIQIRDALDGELAARAPSFPEYLSAYRDASKPINRMEVGREILGRSSSTAQDALGNPILTPSGVARATNDLDAIAAKATDFKKARAKDILSADDLKSLRAIQDDMQRIAQRNRSAATGSQTAERMSVGERAAVRGVASKLPWVGPLFEHFEQASNQRLTERLAFLMANPKEAQRVMAALPAQDAGALRKTLGQLALASGRSAQPATDQK